MCSVGMEGGVVDPANLSQSCKTMGSLQHFHTSRLANLSLLSIKVGDTP